MRITKDVQVGDKIVTVHELTVGDIRAWLKAVEVTPGSGLVDVALFEDASLSDVMRLSSVNESDLDDMTPSQVRCIIDAAKELNTDFFAMRGRLANLGRLLAQSPQAKSESP